MSIDLNDFPADSLVFIDIAYELILNILNLKYINLYENSVSCCFKLNDIFR